MVGSAGRGAARVIGRRRDVLEEASLVGIRPAQMGLRLTFLINLILGILFWTGKAGGGLVLLHMLLGILFVALLWWLGVAQGLRGGSIGLTLGTFILGLILALVGLTQASIGGLAIQIIHLLLALLAVGLGEMAGARGVQLGAKKA
jgi:hypothetical protein